MKTIEHITIEIRGSFTIEEAANDVIALTHITQFPIHFEFNGVKLVARPGDTIKGLVNAYYKRTYSRT